MSPSVFPPFQFLAVFRQALLLGLLIGLNVGHAGTEFSPVLPKSEAACKPGESPAPTPVPPMGIKPAVDLPELPFRTIALRCERTLGAVQPAPIPALQRRRLCNRGPPSA